jgi:hypothetical protein
MSDFEKGAEAFREAAVRALAFCPGAARKIRALRFPATPALPLPAPAQQSESREASAMPDENGRIAIENLRCDQCDNIAGHLVKKRTCVACADVKTLIDTWRAYHAAKLALAAKGTP